MLASAWGALMYKVPETIRITHSHRGGIVLDVKYGRMFDLNPVGTRILKLLGAGSSELEIIETISSEYGVPRDLVESDVQEFMQALRDHRVIEEENFNGQA